MSKAGCNASQASECEETDSERLEKPAPDSDVKMITDHRICSEVVPPPKPSSKNVYDEPLNRRVPMAPARARARTSTAETTRPSRPRGLQYTTPVSAPEVPHQSSREGTDTARQLIPRSVSQGQSTVFPAGRIQYPEIFQRAAYLGDSLPVAFHSTNKRRRSEHTAQNNNATSQDLRPVHPAPNHSLALPYDSSPSFRNLTRSEALRKTTKRNNLEPRSDSSDGGDLPSSMSSDTAIETLPDSRVPRLGRSVSASDPHFRPYYEERISNVRVTHKVFETMQKVLSDKKNSDNGYIYTLRMAGRPGFVKIGRTINTIDERTKQIKKCFKNNLEPINDDDFCRVENHTRVEKLIHDELRNYRQSLPCTCKQKDTKHDGDANDGITTHGEWFEVDETKAIVVVTRWRKWMSTRPYEEGNLKEEEKLRINMYNKDADLMNAMTIEKDDQWCWHVFMRDPTWQLRRLWLRKTLFGERYGRSTCSLWDSLWKHWRSNVIFVLLFFILSCFLSVVSYVLPLAFAFAPPHAVLNTLVLGSIAILYAA